MRAQTSTAVSHAGSSTGMDIVCAGLSVQYGPTRVLDGIDLRVEDREQLALLGPSGAGKSTLLRVLLGGVRPCAGTVRVGGLDPFDRRQARAIRRASGVVRQRDDLVRGLTARTNVLVGLTHQWRLLDWVTVLRGGVPARYRERLDALGRRHGIADLLDARIENLSGGQRQRVALIRALLPGPGLLLADESTSGLDPVRAGEALRHLRTADATLVVTTHDLPVARQFDRIVALRGGEIVFDGADLTEDDVRDIYGDTVLHEPETAR